MQESRLQRSYHARLRNVQEIRARCESEDIPYSVDFNRLTQPSDEVRKQFAEAYSLAPLPPSDLPEAGAATTIVFERKMNEKYHGEMVASVADRVGKNLQPGVETIYIKSSLNPHYRKAFEPELYESVGQLIENQGVPVIHTSIGWDDRVLSFEDGLDEQMEALWKVTAFVVDSAGNGGSEGYKLEHPYQKHNAASHVPPLVVHVGAAAEHDGAWVVEGYSSANGPSLLAPVAPDKKAIWSAIVGPEPLTGTSISAPYVSGVLAALNRRYGPYLTREQILFAVFATCLPVTHVGSFAPQTPEAKELVPITNAAGLRFEPEYAGFGMIQPHKADAVLAQMVALTQEKPSGLSVPVEERVRVEIPEFAVPKKNAKGLYTYSVTMPAGIALKTTLDLEFAGAHGDVHLTSPNGTRVPLVMSRFPHPDNYFGMTTTHAFTGEPLQGEWCIESSVPLKKLQMNQHHFLANDIVASLDIPELLEKPRPVLAHAKRLTELAREQMNWRGQRMFELSGMTLGGQVPRFQDFESIVSQLQALPPGFAGRARIYTPRHYDIDTRTLAGQADRAARNGATIEERVEHYLCAAQHYRETNHIFEEAEMYSRAAYDLLLYKVPYIDRGDTIATQAAELLERSISIRKEHGWLDLAYIDCCQMYEAQSKIRIHCLHYGMVEEANNAGLAMRNWRREARSLWQSYLGGSDPSAHRIEEGEMGFSDHERIGTDNISQCLTIMAHDPVTLKTGLVHLDNQADVNTLDSFFTHFDNNRLQVRLVGASHARDSHSKENIERVMRSLADKNVDIISADILGGISAPAAVVVDPHDFTIAERVPTKATINAAIGNAALLFTTNNKPLVEQFDFTKSKKRAPIFLSPTALERIRTRYLPRNEAELEQYFRSNNYVGRPIFIDHLLDLIRAYHREWDEMKMAVDDVVQENNLSDVDHRRANEALEKHGFYVGENAREANQPIYDWIRNDLVKDGKLQHAALIGPRFRERAHRLGSPNQHLDRAASTGMKL